MIFVVALGGWLLLLALVGAACAAAGSADRFAGRPAPEPLRLRSSRLQAELAPDHALSQHERPSLARVPAGSRA